MRIHFEFFFFWQKLNWLSALDANFNSLDGTMTVYKLFVKCKNKYIFIKFTANAFNRCVCVW